MTPVSFGYLVKLWNLTQKQAKGQYFLGFKATGLRKYAPGAGFTIYQCCVPGLHTTAK
jgi:hypothetical protein